MSPVAPEEKKEVKTKPLPLLTDVQPPILNLLPEDPNEQLLQEPYYGWTATFGTNQEDAIRHVATDHDGNIYLAGFFFGTIDFNPGSEVDFQSSDYFDVFLTKLDPFGNYCWTSVFPGEALADATSIAFDSKNNVYLAGFFWGSVDFDPGEGEAWRTSEGGYDCYVSKFNSVGELLWAQTFGGSLADFTEGIAVDSQENFSSQDPLSAP